jgi:hypothetical protein
MAQSKKIKNFLGFKTPGWAAKKERIILKNNTNTKYKIITSLVIFF